MRKYATETPSKSINSPAVQISLSSGVGDNDGKEEDDKSLLELPVAAWIESDSGVEGSLQDQY